MHMHARVQETMKGKYFCIKVGFWNDSHIIWEPFQTPIFQLDKAIHGTFQNTQKILRENTRFTRNRESKREFFTKHPQVNIFLIEAFFGLDFQVSRFN